MPVAEGFVITNYHVVSKAGKITILCHGGSAKLPADKSRPPSVRAPYASSATTAVP